MNKSNLWASMIQAAAIYVAIWAVFPSLGHWRTWAATMCIYVAITAHEFRR